MRVLLLIAALVAVAAAQAPSVTHLVSGDTIRGVNEVRATSFAVWDGSAYQADIPSPNIGGGSVRGIVPLGDSQVLLHGTFTSAASGQAATGLVFWDGAAWCIPSLKLYQVTGLQAALAGANNSYSCQLDGTTRGVPLGTTANYVRPTGQPCGGWPLATGTVAPGQVNTVFKESESLLWFMGVFNQVNNWQGGVDGLIGVSYSNGQFTLNTPGRQAVIDFQTKLTGNAGVVAPAANSIQYLAAELTIAGAVSTYYFDRTEFDDVPKLPGSVEATRHASKCMRSHVYVQGGTRVWLCLQGGQVYRLRAAVAADAANAGGVRPMYDNNGAAAGDFWSPISTNTASQGGNFSSTGIAPGQIRDMAVKPGTNDVYVVGNWDSTQEGAYHGCGTCVGSNFLPVASVRSRHIARITNLHQDQFTVAGLAATTSENALYQVGFINVTDVKERGWQDEFAFGQGSAAWINPTNANLGFDSIVFGSASQLWVAGGFRTGATDATNGFNKLTNPLAGQLGLHVLQIDETANTITTVGSRFGPIVSAAGNVASQGRQSVARSGATATGLHFDGTTAVLIDSSGAVNRYNYIIDNDVGTLFNRRFTTELDFGAARFADGTWSPALGGGWKATSRAAEQVAWRGSTLYVYNPTITQAYNTHANTLAYWNGDADNAQASWGNGLSHTNRITSRAAGFANWGAASGAQINGAAGTVNAIHLYDEHSGERKAVIGGQFTWVGEVAAGSVALVNLNDGSAASIGSGLYNVGQANNAIRTNSAAGLKFVAEGTVQAVLATRSGSNAGQLVVAGGTFNAANLVAGSKYQATTTCTRNLAVWSSRDGEDAAFANKWNQLDGGCNGQVNALLQADGFLYVGGAFSACGRAQGNVVRIKYDIKNRLSSIGNNRFQSLGLGTAGTVTSLVEQDGKIYAAGSFGSAAGLGVTTGIARWDENGDDADDHGDWQQVYSECFGNCDSRRDPEAFPYHQGIVNGVNPATRYPAPAGNPSLYATHGRLYLHWAGNAVAMWDGDNWSDLGTAQAVSANFYPQLAYNNDKDNLIMIGAAITSGAHNGASAGFDEWDTKEENWVPGRGGFIGANGAGATPKVINAGVSGTFSAALVAVLAVFAVLF